MSNPASDLSQPADVLIVGGGSAGATLAARLSEDPNRRVLLLEAGPAFTSDQLPAELSNAEHVAAPTFDWGYTARGGSSTAEMAVPPGRVLACLLQRICACQQRSADEPRSRRPAVVPL
jgi:choline dehydrogenase